jgi:hypothetical protein
MDVNEGICGEVLEGFFTKILQDLAHEYVFTNIEIMGPWIQFIPFNHLSLC